MKKLLSLLFGCKKIQPSVKRKKSVQVGMSKKDWEREDAHLAWINKQVSASIYGKRVMVEQPKRKTHQQALNEIMSRNDKILRFLNS